MRDENDIIEYEVVWHGRLSIDIERLEQDRRWINRYQRYVDPNDPDSLATLAGRFIQDLMMDDPRLKTAPFTNGPAEPIYTEISIAKNTVTGDTNG